MKRKYLLLILICSVIVQGTGFAVDYYPEMGMDPFYSSLNPTVLNEEDDNVIEHDTLVDLFKKKKSQKTDKTQKSTVVKQEKKTDLGKHTFILKRKKKEQVPAVNVKTGDDASGKEVETADETFVTPEKKPMTRKELEKALNEEERERQRALEKELNKEQREEIKNKLFFFKKKDKAPAEPAEQIDPNIELTADYMEYFPDRFEVEAIGNAKILFKAQDTTITANKIVFNYDRNILRATENVVLTSPTSVTEGDFVKLDLTKPNGWVENPITKTEDIQLSAKEAFLYSDKIEEYDGVAKILKDDVLSFGARSFASYLNPNRVFNTNEERLTDDQKGVYKLKANKILIDSRDDHEVITIKNVDLYLKNHRIGSVPSVKIVTNKEHVTAETNLPEFGSQNMLGMHFGPAVVLNVPGGSTLKLAPIVTYKDDKWGLGGIARFRNQYNMTEIGYGTSKDQVVIRGRHKLAPGWLLNYSRFTNQSEWFMGYRMPKYSGQLNYSRTDVVDDLKLTFSQRYSAGVFVDRTKKHQDLSDAEWRFRWMTQTYKPIYEFENEEGNVALSTGVVAQTAASVYTTGDTVGLFRIGPSLRTKVGPWNQALIYYQTASAGQSPFHFDRYRYGRSNFVIIENLRVCKYLTLGYLASLAINSDYNNDKLFQENRIMIGVGPEYARLVFGYDGRRRNAMVNVVMLVGTKDSEVEFKKSELNNVSKFGKKKSEQKKVKKRNYKKFLKDKEAIVLDD